MCGLFWRVAMVGGGRVSTKNKKFVIKKQNCYYVKNNFSRSWNKNIDSPLNITLDVRQSNFSCSLHARRVGIPRKFRNFVRFFHFVILWKIEEIQNFTKLRAIFPKIGKNFVSWLHKQLYFAKSLYQSRAGRLKSELKDLLEDKSEIGQYRPDKVLIGI